MEHDSMTLTQTIPAVLLAAVCHALALRIATRMMVDVRVSYLFAVKIIVVEYLAMAVIATAVTWLVPGNNSVPLAAATLAYLSVGAACIGSWIGFDDGARVGVGNGILIQAIQIPLVIPVLIVGSFLIDLQARIGSGG
jgi:hypothetical protein